MRLKRTRTKRLINCDTQMQLPPVVKLHPALWLAIALAIVTTSCSSTHVSRSVNTGSGDPVKGATLLMDHSR